MNLIKVQILWQVRHLVNLEVQISWQEQHFVNLAVQISWQAHNLVNLEVQISWQVQHLVNLEVQISWQAQHFVNLKVQISSWQAHHLANLKSADFVAGTALGATFFDEVLQKCFAQVFNMHVGIQSRRKCVLPCYGLSSAIGLVCSSSRQLSSSRQPLVARTHTHRAVHICTDEKQKKKPLHAQCHCVHTARASTPLWADDAIVAGQKKRESAVRRA